MENQVFEDLLEIVQNPSLRDDARNCGFQYLLGLTASDEGLHQIVNFQKFVPFLITFIENSGENVTALSLAHKCLINISTYQEGASAILNSKEDLILQLLNKICDKDYKFVDYICYLLSNLATCTNILQQKDFTSDASLLNRLLSIFLAPEGETRNKYQFLALYFATISGYPETMRKLINSENFIKSFIHHVNLEEPDVRRMAVAVTLRNICSVTSIHRLLIEKDILSVLLLPLMGAEEYDEVQMEKMPIDCQYLESTKQREPLPPIRKALVQALSLLCYTEDGWKHLVTHSVYLVIRDLHIWETNSATKEAVETLVGFLLVEQYSKISTAGEIVTPSITEVVKDIPDFVVF